MKNVALKEWGVNDDYQSLYEEIGQFVGVPTYLFEYGRYLTVEAKWLYVTLLSFKNQKTKKTFPAYPAMMERSGLSRQKVAAALKELENFHWITKKRNFSKASDYHLTVPVRTSDQQRTICPTKEEQKAYQKQQRDEREDKLMWKRERGAFELWKAFRKNEIQITDVKPAEVKGSEVEDEDFGIPF